MRPLLRCLALAFAVLLLASCASGPGGKLQVAGTATVFDMQLQTDLDWARVRIPRREIWTIDGTPLNQLLIVSAIKPREHVFLEARQRKSRPDGPWFRAGMRPDEVRDIILDALRGGGWADVEPGELRPARFGDTPGLRFDFSLANQRGLAYRGLAAAAERNGKLTVLVWMAPTEHYHDRDVAAVSAMFDSLRFVK